MSDQFDKSRIYYLVFGIFLLLLYLFNPIRIVHYAIFALLPIVIVVGIHRNMNIYGKNNSNYRYLKLLLIGFVFVLIAEILSFILKNIFDIRIFPAPSDYFWIIAVFFLFWGTITKIRQEQITISSFKKILLFVISIFGVGAIAYFIYNPQFSNYQNIINIFFRISQFGFVIVVYLISEIMNEYKNGQMYKPWFYLLIGVILTLIAGIILAIFLTKFKQGVYTYVFWINIIWAFGYLLIGYSFCDMGNILEKSTIDIRLKIKMKNLLSKKL